MESWDQNLIYGFLLFKFAEHTYSMEVLKRKQWMCRTIMVVIFQWDNFLLAQVH